MKITDTIKESATKCILSAIFGLLGILIGSLYSEIIPILLPTIIQELPKSILLKMLTLAILLFFLSFAWSFAIYSKYKTRLTPKCGVLWDKNKEAHCPACEKPLSEYCFVNIPSNPHYKFKCIQCDRDILLMHDSKPISLLEAQKLLKS